MLVSHENAYYEYSSLLMLHKRALEDWSISELNISDLSKYSKAYLNSGMWVIRLTNKSAGLELSISSKMCLITMSTVLKKSVIKVNGHKTIATATVTTTLTTFLRNPKKPFDSSIFWCSAASSFWLAQTQIIILRSIHKLSWSSLCCYISE